jgi:hypothetical protein
MSANQFLPPRRPEDVAPEPRSIARDGERAGAALRGIREMFETAPGKEERAWIALESRRHRKRRVWPLMVVVVAAGAAAIAVVAAPAFDGHGQARRATADVRAPAAADGEPTPKALRAGAAVLPGGLRTNLQTGARATWFPRTSARGHLVLETGTLEIDADAPVDVRIASLRMDGSAGRFRVAAHDAGVELTVEKGEVAVWSSVRLLARVVAGEHWTSRDTAAAPEKEPLAPASASAIRTHRAKPQAIAPSEQAGAPGGPSSTEARDCLRLAHDGVTDTAIACFEEQSAQSGLAGEIALLELARIRRDVKGDLAGAQRLLAEHARRFPHGALAVEARTRRVELLLRLDQPAEALAEAERLSGIERLFWRAVSLEKLHRRDEAARAFDEYLRHDNIERRAEAMRKRRELGP